MFHLNLLKILLISFMLFASSTANSDMQRLLADLLKDDQPKIRPVVDDYHNVTVSVALAPRNVFLDDVNQKMTVEAWGFFNWNNPFLTWDPDSYGGIDRMNLDSFELWLPDIAVYNRLGSTEGSPFGNVPVIVMYTGDVLWFPPTEVSVPCNVNLKMWPNDQHNCSINMGSWSHHGEQVDLRIMTNNSGVLLENYVNGNEWNLVNFSAIKRTQSVNGDKHVDLSFHFVLQRMATEKLNYILISIIVASTSVLSSYFLATDQLIGRLLLNLFSLTVLLSCEFLLLATLPSHEGPVPILVGYYGISIFLSVISLVTNLWLYNRTTGNSCTTITDVCCASIMNAGRYNRLRDTGALSTAQNGTTSTEPSVGGQALGPDSEQERRTASATIAETMAQYKLDHKIRTEALKIKCINLSALIIFAVGFAVNYLVIRLNI